MKYVVNFIIAILFGFYFTLLTMPGGEIKNNLFWIGPSIGLGIALFGTFMNSDKINKLEDEIKHLKENIK